MSRSEVGPPGARLLATRLAIGLSQGFALYGLWRWAAQLTPVSRGALALTLGLVPVVALGAIGAARRTTVIAWLAAATAITAGLGAYHGFAFPPERGTWTSPNVAIFTAAALFILHHLILPGDAERRWRATYERYFDEGWKAAVRLALAALFVGALWLLLGLGASLFHLIGIDFIRRLIAKRWFSYPVTATAFAIAVHVTDIRAGLVRGVRTLVLTLLSWLLPLMALIAAGFLLSLPFTGLKSLWATRSASGVMLAACAALVILINAAYQDGERDDFPPRLLKWATRVAAIALAPLTLVAVYGVLLRIGQRGLTPQRIHALACLLIAACYAGGYAWAALSRGRWMKRLELTNWITAQIAVAVLIAIFSPVLDPARISVASQLHRLESGAVAPQAFDFKFLRFGSGRWGQSALKRLASAKGGPRQAQIAELAGAQLKLTNIWERPATTGAQRMASIKAIGSPLPAGFLTQSWTAQEDPAKECAPESHGQTDGEQGCVAVTADLDNQPGPEVIVFSGFAGGRVFSERDGRWIELGRLSGESCGDDRTAVHAGKLRLIPPAAHSDIEVGGRRRVLVPQTAEACPSPDARKRPAAPAL